MLALGSGLRRGEIVGLQWDDIDLKAGTLSVRRALSDTRQGVLVQPPKSAKSVRTIALLPFVTEVLQRHKGEQAQHRLRYGPGYRDEGWVIASPDGSPMDPGALTKAWAARMNRLGYKGLWFHDLRRSHSSQFAALRENPKVVSDRMGHSGIGITLDLYTHLARSEDEAAALRLDAAWRAAMAEMDGASVPAPEIEPDRRKAAGE